ncbi:hypothetical protein HNR23_002178 [Nocardiopsis mwathae]|uniref:SseB protein N-terminal domain-containing protein n=1 Tax=Nocardiopsis mwathae TaxID=1472723 RepID=A0A7W9YH93_9ACTN|nr:SAV_915 family protein [Nocardiopsis mwathae]MBB6172118.1 hypothetical protein [Nocardiopsis mwathae]
MCVPVHATHGVECVRLARLGTGERVAIEFTTPERLRAAMGPGQEWIRMAESALRALVRPLGVTRIQADPSVVAPPTAAAETRRCGRGARRRAAGAGLGSWK